jgi:hypothetical protein
MARNRRTQSAEVRFGPALKALLICLFIGGAGVGYVCQKNQLNQLGRQKKEREMQLEQLRLRNAQFARQLAERQSLPVLERRVRDLNLGLGLPHPAQVVVLEDRLPATPRKGLSPAPAGHEGVAAVQP